MNKLVTRKMMLEFLFIYLIFNSKNLKDPQKKQKRTKKKKKKPEKGMQCVLEG